MIKKIFSVIVIFFLFTPLTNSQHLFDRQIQVGLDKIYNFNWSEGSKVFNTVIKKDPHDPRGYHYKSIIYLWYYLGNFNEAYLDTFYYLADKSLELADEKIKTNPSADLSYLIGSIYYNKSIAEARSGNYLQALWMSNQMKQNLDDAVNKEPDLYDAYLGLGLYNFALSQIPSSLEWAANLVGIDADKEAGLDYVKKSAQKGKLSKIDAEYYLSQIYSRVIVNHPAAKELLSNLVKRYPKNLLFNFSLGWVNYELNDLNSAFKQLKPIIASKDSLYPFVVSNSCYLMGNIFFSESLYDSAITYYKLFLETAVNDDYKGIANLRIGLSYELGGNRKEALKFYEKAASGNSDIDEDMYAERKKNDFLDNKLSVNQIKLIRFSNLIKQNKIIIAKDSLKDFIELPKLDNNMLAEAYLYLSEISYRQKKYKESLDFAVNCVKTEIKSDLWIHAYAHYFAAWDCYYLKKFTDARLFLLQIDEIDEYDFSSSLSNKIYSLQRLLPGETKK
ncbi:MAG: tetratricopeptide repeat protein [Ignavibacteriaceae bacterium]